MNLTTTKANCWGQFYHNHHILSPKSSLKCNNVATLHSGSIPGLMHDGVIHLVFSTGVPCRILWILFCKCSLAEVPNGRCVYQYQPLVGKNFKLSFNLLCQKPSFSYTLDITFASPSFPGVCSVVGIVWLCVMWPCLTLKKKFPFCFGRTMSKQHVLRGIYLFDHFHWFHLVNLIFDFQ